MCGINGLITTEPKGDTEVSRMLTKMNQEIFHRGPDQGGIFVEKGDNCSIGMAMRRLSIIDLSTGEQPMATEDNNIVLVFNGEIYNYRHLKKDLQKKNIEFKTTSDTEVILRLYEAFGKQSFSMLDGMFAFSLYDKRINKVFIVRDFFGEKPLYFFPDSSSFFWASELKSIIEVQKDKPKIALEGLNLYFQLTYIPAPYTIYEGIYKLEANHYLEYDCNVGKYEIHEVEQDIATPPSEKIDFDEAKKKTQDMVSESVSSRSIADVPLGTFLSGGVDSSIVSLCLAKQSDQKIDTFSVGFDKKSFDETEKSREVATLINSNHHEFIVNEGDLKENLDSILLNFDEPFADSSSLPTYLVASKTRQHVKVALTGDGGDEVFGGYNKYYMGKLNSRYTSMVPQNFHKSFLKVASPVLSTKDDNRGLRFKLKRLLHAVNYEGDFYYNIISLAFQKHELKELLEEEYQKMDVLNLYKAKTNGRNNTLTDFRNIDKMLSLEGDMLVKVDRTSMLTSLESRAPFLNKQLWNFTSSLPENFLMKGWNKKYLLKEAFKEYFPEGFLDKSKKGFGVPVGDWLRGYLKPELLFYSEKKFLDRQNIFHTEIVQKLIEDHISGRTDNTFRIWTFFCFQKWYINSYSK